MQVIGCLLGLVVCSISSIHVKPVINGDVNDLAQDRPGSYLIATNNSQHTLQKINGKDYVRVEYKQIPCKKKTQMGADNHSSNNLKIRVIKTGFETTCQF